MECFIISDMLWDVLLCPILSITLGDSKKDVQEIEEFKWLSSHWEPLLTQVQATCVLVPHNEKRRNLLCSMLIQS